MNGPLLGLTLNGIGIVGKGLNPLASELRRKSHASGGCSRQSYAQRPSQPLHDPIQLEFHAKQIRSFWISFFALDLGILK